jgi:ectoine hydroxylase-related dioxygenase (phytanoyl-CoA dioxygenase family)
MQTDAVASPSARDLLTVFDYVMQTRGWMLFESVVPADFVDRMREDIAKHVERCGRLQVAAGIGLMPDKTAHHALGKGDSLDEFLARGIVHPFVSRFFGDAPYILHAFNPVMVAPHADTYLHRIHRDIATHAGAFRLLLNVLVLVDDFTLENGATHILSGSHSSPDRPPDEIFWRHAERIVGRAGSVVLFDSNVWHAAGRNVSDRSRAALTLSFSRPFYKPQMDYARFLGPEYGARLTDGLRQLLGYHAQVPTDYDEWYRPAATRLYRADNW